MTNTVERLNNLYKLEVVPPLPSDDGEPDDSTFDYDVFVYFFYDRSPLGWLIRLGQLLLGFSWASPTHCIVGFKDESKRLIDFFVDVTGSSICFGYNLEAIEKVCFDKWYVGTVSHRSVWALEDELKTIETNRRFFSFWECVLWSFKLRWFQLMGNCTKLNSCFTATGTFEEKTNVVLFVPPFSCTFPIWYTQVVDTKKDYPEATPLVAPTIFCPASLKREIWGR